MKNNIGDRCFADTFKIELPDEDFLILDDTGRNRKVSLMAEVDGTEFCNLEYKNDKAWLQDIIKRAQDCALGQLNYENHELDKRNKKIVDSLDDIMRLAYDIIAGVNTKTIKKDAEKLITKIEGKKHV